MPVRIHTALHSATAAAAHLRSLLRDLAAAVAQGDEATIAHHARALVQGSGAQAAIAIPVRASLRRIPALLSGATPVAMARRAASAEAGADWRDVLTVPILCTSSGWLPMKRLAAARKRQTPAARSARRTTSADERENQSRST